MLPDKAENNQESGSGSLEKKNIEIIIKMIVQKIRIFTLDQFQTVFI